MQNSIPQDIEVDLTNKIEQTFIPHDMQDADRANHVYPDRGVVQQTLNDPSTPVYDHGRMSMSSTLCQISSEIENNEEILSPRFNAECMKSTGHVADDIRLQSTRVNRIECAATFSQASGQMPSSEARETSAAGTSLQMLGTSRENVATPIPQTPTRDGPDLGLKPSLHEEVLTEKKAALLKSPEVMRFLQMRQADIVKQMSVINSPMQVKDVTSNR